MGAFTESEQAWIKRLKAATKGKPASLRLYVMDGDCVIVAKAGVPVNSLSETVWLRVAPCATVTDAHDDMDYGRR